MRMRHPLVPDEPPSPLCRVLAAADSGNGVSAALDYHRWRFINPDLTVYLMRPPTGEWVALEAATTVAAGVGLADTTLHDERGPIGRAAQALFVDRR
jgi:Thioesterase-like superfamily